ncbi:MAG: ERCC4 domain-containing protein [Thermoprotei archaeon]
MDTREPDEMRRLLEENGIKTCTRFLTVADYAVSEDEAVERKTATDFVKSLFDGRLLDQAKRLRESYKKPIMVIEGDLGQQLSWRKNPRSFWGAMASLSLDSGIALFFTPSLHQTAELLTVLFRRQWVKRENKGGYRPQVRPKVMSKRERQLFVLEGLPGVGPQLGERLLDRFGSVKGVVMASSKELASVAGIGEKKAAAIRQLLDAPWTVEKNDQSKLL